MSAPQDVDAVLNGIRERAPRALGRALTWIENGDPRGIELENALGVPPVGFRVGFTGPPGVGESSVVGRLIPELRRRSQSVAVLAVDPTSPITGGALLGDRVRMRGNEDDREVFIRSLATRHGVGGVAGASAAATDFLVHAGFDTVLVETVGVGQLEIGVVEEADAVFLLLSPESGDVIQLLKGGLVELVDRVVVNKCDRSGADELLRVASELAVERGDPPPIAVSANTGEGIDTLADEIVKMASVHRENPDPTRAHRRITARVRRHVERQWLEAAWSRAGGLDALRDGADRIASGDARFAETIERLTDAGNAPPTKRE